MPTEAQLRTKIVTALRDWGARPVKYHGSPYSEAGVSDLLVCYKGRFVAIEVKLPGGKPTDKQSAFLAEIVAAQGVAGTARTIEEALAHLKQVDTDIENDAEYFRAST